jgi:flagellar biosynthetic protein FlhB
MSEAPEQDQKTEDPTDKRTREAVKKGDVLQSKELGVALVTLAGAAWLFAAGHLLVGAMENMLIDGLSFSPEDISGFDPASTALRLIGMIALPVFALFGLTLVAAVATPALLGSLGFRSEAFAFNANKMNPMTGLKRMFGKQGLVELGKSLAKVLLLGGIGIWLLLDEARGLVGLSSQDIRPALASVGSTFVIAVLVMALGLVVIAAIDIPAVWVQRMGRLRMSKQEVRDEHKQTEGSPELKGAIRRRQHEVVRGSARSAVAEATVILTNPTHFAVALRYRPGEDAAPVVVARGRGATAEAIRELAKESTVPILSYPQLARALYFTTRTGHVIREDLYLSVAAVLAFVFNLNAALASGAAQPPVDVPAGARFDEKGRPET